MKWGFIFIMVSQFLFANIKEDERLKKDIKKQIKTVLQSKSSKKEMIYKNILKTKSLLKETYEQILTNRSSYPAETFDYINHALLVFDQLPITFNDVMSCQDMKAFIMSNYAFENEESVEQLHEAIVDYWKMYKMICTN